MLTTLRKHFHYAPNWADTLKEIQLVLNQPEMKVIKPSDTRWLAPEWCVKAIKASYQNFQAPEALEFHKALSKFTTIAAIYLLYYTLPLVAKLSKSPQTKQLDLSMISSLVDAVPTHWMKPLIQQHSGFGNFGIPWMLFSKQPEIVSGDKIHTMQETVEIPFVGMLRKKICVSTGHTWSS